jgi:hypothetical protein
VYREVIFSGYSAYSKSPSAFGKRCDSSLLSKWLIQNATFLPDDGQPLRHAEMHLDTSTHQADFKITVAKPKYWGETKFERITRMIDRKILDLTPSL